MIFCLQVTEETKKVVILNHDFLAIAQCLIIGDNNYTNESISVFRSAEIKSPNNPDLTTFKSCQILTKN